MGRTSKTVSIVGGIEVMKITLYDCDADLVETGYFVRGAEYRTLKEARRAAQEILESG